MHITTEKTDGVCRMRLAGEATIYTVMELHRALCTALADCTELEVNLADVSDMDTAGLQQLLLAKREAVRLEKVLRLVQLSPATRDVLDLYHMAAYFGASLADTAVVDPGEQQHLHTQGVNHDES